MQNLILVFGFELSGKSAFIKAIQDEPSTESPPTFSFLNSQKTTHKTTIIEIKNIQILSLLEKQNINILALLFVILNQHLEPEIEIEENLIEIVFSHKIFKNTRIPVFFLLNELENEQSNSKIDFLAKKYNGISLSGSIFDSTYIQTVKRLLTLKINSFATIQAKEKIIKESESMEESFSSKKNSPLIAFSGLKMKIGEIVSDNNNSNNNDHNNIKSEYDYRSNFNTKKVENKNLVVSSVSTNESNLRNSSQNIPINLNDLLSNNPYSTNTQQIVQKKEFKSKNEQDFNSIVRNSLEGSKLLSKIQIKKEDYESRKSVLLNECIEPVLLRKNYNSFKSDVPNGSFANDFASIETSKIQEIYSNITGENKHGGVNLKNFKDKKDQKNEFLLESQKKRNFDKKILLSKINEENFTSQTKVQSKNIQPISKVQVGLKKLESLFENENKYQEINENTESFREEDSILLKGFNSEYAGGKSSIDQQKLRNLDKIMQELQNSSNPDMFPNLLKFNLNPTDQIDMEMSNSNADLQILNEEMHDLIKESSKRVEKGNLQKVNKLIPIRSIQSQFKEKTSQQEKINLNDKNEKKMKVLMIVTINETDVPVFGEDTSEIVAMRYVSISKTNLTFARLNKLKDTIKCAINKKIELILKGQIFHKVEKSNLQVNVEPKRINPLSKQLIPKDSNINFNEEQKKPPFLVGKQVSKNVGSKILNNDIQKSPLKNSHLGDISSFSRFDQNLKQVDYLFINESKYKPIPSSKFRQQEDPFEESFEKMTNNVKPVNTNVKQVEESFKDSIQKSLTGGKQTLEKMNLNISIKLTDDPCVKAIEIMEAQNINFIYFDEIVENIKRLQKKNRRS